MLQKPLWNSNGIDTGYHEMLADLALTDVKLLDKIQQQQQKNSNE